MKGGPNPGPSTWKDHHGCGRHRICIGVVGVVGGDITTTGSIAITITTITSITTSISIVTTTSTASTAASVMIRRGGSHIQRRTSTTAILQTTGRSTSTVAGGGGEWSTHCVCECVDFSCVILVYGAMLWCRESLSL